MNKLVPMKQWMINLNLSLHALCYTSLVAGVYFGTPLSWFYILLVCIFIGINEQAFFHRMLSHRSWDCPVWLKIVGVHVSTLSLLGPVICWVSVHRQHHQYSDTEKDPHSPLFMSKWRIQFLSSSFPFNIIYAADLVKNKITFFYTRHYLSVIFLTWLVISLILGVENFFLIWLAGTGLSIILANITNSLNHGKIRWTVQRRENNKDYSINNIILGYLNFDGWHNNHHSDPKKYYFGNKWWQLDFCGMYIWLLSALTGYRNSLRR